MQRFAVDILTKFVTFGVAYLYLFGVGNEIYLQTLSVGRFDLEMAIITVLSDLFSFHNWDF